MSINASTDEIGRMSIRKVLRERIHTLVRENMAKIMRQNTELRTCVHKLVLFDICRENNLIRTETKNSDKILSKVERMANDLEIWKFRLF